MVQSLHADASLARRFLQLAAAQAGEAGISLRRRHDMAALAAVNRANRESWPPLIPLFDAAQSVLTRENALWVNATNRQGETVATYAARFFHWPRSTLAEEARSLRIFYTDPAPHRARGEFVEFPEDGAWHEITGRTAATGALWIQPDYRRLGLTRILSRACKAYAYELWEPSIFWALINPIHLESGVARAWGSITVVRGARLCVGGQNLPAAISFQNRQQFLSDVAHDTRQGMIVSSRRTLTVPTKRSDREARHGIISRS